MLVNLCIFSFNQVKMIKKSFICFFVFSAIYAIIVYFYPNKGIGTHQWQENQIRAQRYLYENAKDTVMIGTSLSARLLPDSISMVSSCSFSACVVEDGLRIILSKNKAPHMVLIESNYFLRPSNGEFVNVNTKGLIPLLRYFLPMLREYNSPISLIGYCFMRGALAPSDNVDTLRLSRIIEQRKIEDSAHFLTNKQVKDRLDVIIPLIHEIEARGAKIVLFEMPLNESMIHLPSNDQTRQIVKQVFPPHKYVYLPIDTTKYLTTDGEHLELRGQYRYSSFIKKVLSNI